MYRVHTLNSVYDVDVENKTVLGGVFKSPRTYEWLEFMDGAWGPGQVLFIQFPHNDWTRTSLVRSVEILENEVI